MASTLLSAIKLAVDGYANDTGFPLTGADQLRFNVMLANEAHRRSLSALLKNDLARSVRCCLTSTRR